MPRPFGEDEEAWELDTPHLPNLVVYEPEGVERTGLLDADGNPLVRLKRPIGYLADL